MRPHVRGVLAGALVFTLALFWRALPAWAEVDGNCSASINGVDVGQVSSGDSGQAIEVKQHTGVPVTMTSAQAIAHLRIQLEFAGIRWTVRDEPTEGTSWEKSAPVDRYAKYGVGLYKVIGQSVGPDSTCSGSALVRVLGNPLTTVVGAAAAGVTAVGAAGVLASGAASALEGQGSSARAEQWVADELERQAWLDQRDREEDEWEGYQRAALAQQRDAARTVMEFCYMLVLPALLLTSLAMVGGAGPPPSARPAVRLRRAIWRPRISAAGLVGGLLGGAGSVVLLQQYALVYPTRAVAIEGLVGGLALGIAVPSLLRVFAIRRANRAIARSERRLSEAAAERSRTQEEAQG
ncbi:MAG TPA: hypothetical protein VFT91_02455 [Dehalococcoidia bacterium]|nr:hypothetical protein [Dehalococcoidia bacterium]